MAARAARRAARYVNTSTALRSHCIARRNMRWYGYVKGVSHMGKKDKGGKETRKPKKPKA